MDEIENENHQDENQMNQHRDVTSESENQTSSQSQNKKNRRKSKKEKKNPEPIESPDIPLSQENSEKSLGFTKKEVKSVHINSDKEENLNESLEEPKRGLLVNATPKGKNTTKNTDNIHEDSN
jgi:hypothetical protein